LMVGATGSSASAPPGGPPSMFLSSVTYEQGISQEKKLSPCTAER
jgi:hypothetical protein